MEEITTYLKHFIIIAFFRVVNRACFDRVALILISVVLYMIYRDI